MQMIQRAKMATLTKAYSKMKVITDHSFESVPYGMKSMSEFVKLNYEHLNNTEWNENVGCLSPYGKSACVNRYIVSNGSLNAGVTIDTIGPSTDGNLEINLAFGLGDTPFSVTNLVPVNVLAEKGMATWVFLLVNHNYTDANFFWMRIKSDVIDLSKELTSLKDLIGMNGFETNIPNNIAEHWRFEKGENGEKAMILPFSNISENSGFNIGCSCIFSKNISGAWLRSRSELQLAEEPPINFEDALATYPIRQNYILNGGKV